MTDTCLYGLHLKCHQAYNTYVLMYSTYVNKASYEGFLYTLSRQQNQQCSNDHCSVRTKPPQS